MRNFIYKNMNKMGPLICERNKIFCESLADVLTNKIKAAEGIVNS
jgi:hypothetical protein